jgi:hypothetical protein
MPEPVFFSDVTNGDRDALLVVGMATIKQDGVEKVASVTPAKVSESDAQRTER